MNVDWPTVSLGELLDERRESPSDIDLISGKVRVVSKVSFNDGRIHLRQSQETRTRMILVRPGDILISGINAAKGAIAIHDADASGPIAATIHYAAYQVDTTRAEPKFLWWLLRSDFFRDLLASHVPGGIKTELKSKRLLPIPIPLPPLAEQHRIVDRIKALAAKVDEAKKAQALSIDELVALRKANITACMASLNVNAVLEDVLLAAPRNGWSPICDNVESGIPVLSLSAVTGWHFNSYAFKRTSHPTDPDAHYWVSQGDLLITRSNSPELVGHAAISDGFPELAIYPDLIMKLIIDSSKSSTRFVWHWLQTAQVRDFIRYSSKGTSPTMKKISQKIVKRIPFPSNVSLREQNMIIHKIDMLNAVTNRVDTIQKDTSIELEAMLPAILDRALKGGL